MVLLVTLRPGWPELPATRRPPSITLTSPRAGPGWLRSETDKDGGRTGGFKRDWASGLSAPCGRRSAHPLPLISLCKYAALVCTSATGPSPRGSSVRMVSCSRTYQPS